jgi:F0F1-type ATP synthase assembly protein I
MMARKPENPMQMVGRYLSLAFMLPLTAFIGYAIGYFLDRAFQTSFLKIVFLLVGIAAGFLELFRTLNKDSKDL